VCVCVFMCGFCNVWVCVCVCGFCNVWVFVCVGVFDNFVDVLVICVLVFTVVFYCFVCVYLSIFVTNVRTTATE